MYSPKWHDFSIISNEDIVGCQSNKFSTVLASSEPIVKVFLRNECKINFMAAFSTDLWSLSKKEEGLDSLVNICCDLHNFQRTYLQCYRKYFLCLWLNRTKFGFQKWNIKYFDFISIVAYNLCCSSIILVSFGIVADNICCSSIIWILYKTKECYLKK